MKIALAQINPFIGAFSYNCEKICRFAQQAAEKGCDLVVFPELALIGYPPRDLLEKTDFIRNSQKYWSLIREASKSIGIICGVVATNQSVNGKAFHNSALFCSEGSLIALAHKRLLPSYDVFDEERYFEPGKEPVCLDFKGKKLGITICEDIWTEEPFLPRPLYKYNPVQELAGKNVDILFNISASPFHVGKVHQVSELLRGHAVKNNLHIAYVNLVGGNDELIFQGRSMVFNPKGELVRTGAQFQEDLAIWDTENPELKAEAPSALDAEDEILQALILGLRDYAAKCGFHKAVLGLSGGIDSAVTACLARMSFGPENIRTVAMPGPFTAGDSLDLSRELADRTELAFEVVPIDELYNLANQALSSVFAGMPKDVTEENIQARLRGLILMSISNKFNELLLNTGNKSELSVGYCTLYGDLTGGLSVLGDVPKNMVYKIAARINERQGWIPERIITRPPSAELSPGQKDEDSLPPYHILDAILSAYVENNLSAEQIIEQGFEPQTVKWVIRRVNGNEYKRRQAPPVLKVTSKAFGMGRRLPVAHGYREE